MVGASALTKPYSRGSMDIISPFACMPNRPCAKLGWAHCGGKRKIAPRSRNYGDLNDGHDRGDDNGGDGDGDDVGNGW